jgi:hypothetical protein
MRHPRLLAIAVLLCATPFAHAFTITPIFVNSPSGDLNPQTWTSAEEAVVNEAINDWTSILSYSDPNQNINILFEFHSAGLNVLPGPTPTGYLGLWSGQYSAPVGSVVDPWSPTVTVTQMGTQMEGSILNVNTDWMTPPAGDPTLTFTTGTPGPGMSTVSSSTFDALSVIRHELGHALGLNTLYTSDVMPQGQPSPAILSALVTAAGPTGAIFDDTPGGLNIPLASAGNQEHVADNNDLMSVTLTNGVRKGIGFTDIEELSLAYNYAVTIPAGLSYPTTTFKTETITLNGAVRVSSTTGARNTPAVVLQSQNLTINPGGLLDLSNHDLIINGGQTLGSVQNLIAAGRGNGTWNGTTGITSSTANAGGETFGIATAGALNVSTFDGLAVSPSTILVKYTFAGDATLDGTVNLSDLDVVLNNLGSTSSLWSSGNFDGAATIDLTDLNDVLNHLGVSVPTGSSAVATAEALLAAGGTGAVPEPASLSLLALAVPLLLRKRRR